MLLSVAEGVSRVTITIHPFSFCCSRLKEYSIFLTKFDNYNLWVDVCMRSSAGHDSYGLLLLVLVCK